MFIINTAKSCGLFVMAGGMRGHEFYLGLRLVRYTIRDRFQYQTLDVRLLEPYINSTVTITTEKQTEFWYMESIISVCIGREKMWTESTGPASDTPTQPRSPVTVLGSSCADRAQRPPQQGRHVEGVRRNVLENINTGQ